MRRASSPSLTLNRPRRSGLVNRIIAEQEQPVCDLFWNNEIMHTVRLQKIGAFAVSATWIYRSDYPPDMVASDGTWCGFAARARVLLVNTKLIPESSRLPDL